MTALKHLPEIGIVGGLVYTGVQNVQLEKEVQSPKTKIMSISSLMINVTKIQYEDVQTEMNQLIKQKNNILLEIQINEYCESLQGFLASIQRK